MAAFVGAVGMNERYCGWSVVMQAGASTCSKSERARVAPMPRSSIVRPARRASSDWVLGLSSGVSLESMDTSTILTLILFAHVVHFAVIPVVGRFSDKLGRKPVYAAGAVLAAVWGFIAFPLFDTENDWLIVGVLILGLVIHALMAPVCIVCE